MPLLCEFDGVADQIEQDLTYFAGVSVEYRSQLIADLKSQIQPLLRSQGAHERDDSDEEFCQVEIDGLGGDFSRLDL